MKSRFLIPVLGLLAATALLSADAALACSCAPMDRKGAKQAFRDADGAIIGKLKKRRLSNDGTERILTYKVRRSFKQRNRIPEGERINVRTPASGAACGIESRVGSVRGLFLDRRQGRLRSHLCSVISPRKMRRTAHALAATNTPITSVPACSA